MTPFFSDRGQLCVGIDRFVVPVFYVETDKETLPAGGSVLAVGWSKDDCLHITGPTARMLGIPVNEGKQAVLGWLYEEALKYQGPVDKAAYLKQFETPTKKPSWPSFIWPLKSYG
ncbi:MAG: hypothetical protein WAX89_06680 [Alphaproteobacteria bacterium]